MFIWITYNSAIDYIEQGFTAEEASLIISESTIQAIEDALHNLGHQTQRIGNVFQLIKQLESKQRCDLVFNLADGSIGSGREALIPALLDAYKIGYTFSDPVTLAICTNKAFAKQLAQQAGIKTAPFITVKKIADIAEINLDYPLFIKPSMAGRSLGIDEKALVLKQEDLLVNSARLLQKYKQPVLVESYLPGREFSVGIIGEDANSKSLGVMEIKSNAAEKNFFYHRFNKIHSETAVQRITVNDTQAKQAEHLAIHAWKIFGCRGAGRIDLRCDQSGEPNFVEANPIPGLNPVNSDLAILAKLNNMSYTSLIERIISKINC